MRTVQKLYDLANHAVGYAVAEGHDLWEDINSAGQALFDARPWSWLTSNPTTIMAVANREWLALPDDFDGSATFTALDAQPVHVVTLDIIEDYRRRAENGQSVMTGQGWLVSLQAHDQDPVGSGTPVRRADIFPTPTADGPLLSAVYQRRWRRVDSTDPNAVPNIAPELEFALVCKVRAIACQLENQMFTVDEQAFEKEVERAWAKDRNRLINGGRMKGGADRFDFRPIRRGNGPSPTEITRT